MISILIIIIILLRYLCIEEFEKQMMQYENQQKNVFWKDNMQKIIRRDKKKSYFVQKSLIPGCIWMCSLRFHAQCSYGSFVFPSHGFLLVIITNITIIIVTHANPLSSVHPHYVLYLKQSYGPFVFPCYGFLSVSSTLATSRAFSSVLSSSRASASPKKLKQLCLCISKKTALMFLVGIG